MRSRVILIAILAGTLLLPILPAQAQQTTLVVTGYGGRWSEVMKKALVEPFERDDPPCRGRSRGAAARS